MQDTQFFFSLQHYFFLPNHIDIIVHPPKLDSRHALSGWLCMQHNLVNKKIGKPLFDCTHVLERWRYGWKDNDDCKLPEQD
ncbi:unnamed protein product [Schistosoma margrebowiei]|uniref:Sulfhydryl oxidase n=1 Tax=Schistosoma margrebowiei TaxID=48269 RepID=A0A183MAD7_9TREM|nr:unnamed protein product [Schistosoma margrebowiei]